MRAGPRRKRIRNFYVAWHTWQLYYVHSHWYTLVGVVSKEVNDISHSLSFTSGYLYIFLLVTRLTLSEISEDYYLSILRCLYYLFWVPSCMKCKKWIFNYSFWHLKGKPWKCSTHGAMEIVSALPQMNRRQVLFPEYPSLWYASRTKTFTLFSLSLSLSFSLSRLFHALAPLELLILAHLLRTKFKSKQMRICKYFCLTKYFQSYSRVLIVIGVLFRLNASLCRSYMCCFLDKSGYSKVLWRPRALIITTVRPHRYVRARIFYGWRVDIGDTKCFEWMLDFRNFRR